jgi:hypothetical protein
MTLQELTLTAAGPTIVCMVAVFAILGIVYLIARRNEAFYVVHKYPLEDRDFTHARGFKAKCSVALWCVEALLASLLAATVFYPLTAIPVMTVAVISAALVIYRNWPNLKSES